MKRKKLIKELAHKATDINLILNDVINLIEASDTDEEVRDVLAPHVDTDHMGLTFGGYAKSLSRKMLTVNLAISDLLKGEYVEEDIQDAIDC